MQQKEIEELVQAVAEILAEDGLNNPKDPIGYMSKAMNSEEFSTFCHLLKVESPKVFSQKLQLLIRGKAR